MGDSSPIEWTPFFPAYLAGLFDGEGSAVVLTVRRSESRQLYEFRPVIKISQNNRKFLQDLADITGWGTAQRGYSKPEKAAVWQIASLKQVRAFIQLVRPHTILKNEVLDALSRLVDLKLLRRRGGWGNRYTEKELKEILRLREEVHKGNRKTRAGITLRYSDEAVLKELAPTWATTVR